MARYIVGVPEVHYVYVDVEADNKEDARKEAKKVAMRTLVDNPGFEYSHVLDEEWRVEEA